MSYYGSEEMSDLKQECLKLKNENKELRSKLRKLEKKVGVVVEVKPANWLCGFSFVRDGLQLFGSTAFYLDHRPTLDELKELVKQVEISEKLSSVCILTVNELGVQTEKKDR